MCSQHQHKYEEVLSTKKRQNVQLQGTTYKCSNCGVTHAANDKFCDECGMLLNGNSGARCGVATQPN